MHPGSRGVDHGSLESCMERDARLNPARFREIMGHYPTGVTVVTALHRDGTPFGLTANSVTSVSLDPPLLLVCVSEKSSSLGAIRSSGAFAVNVLGAGAAATAARFAEVETERRFEGIGYSLGDGGAPILDGVVAWLSCSLYRTFEAGDHLILVGRVHGADATGGDPLLFVKGQYGALES